ncbi:DUF2381 family protein [Pyxidicoccus fallax]|uniref:DUF2381 family protein n=1 Tax=Pyxidicoccus fallax TaxID=394095 RepID=A0A848LHI9_9BACT|nr:DUF2381 family protein [Pyxidicoccus fallax]NPC81301.1 DUF2381 family protein [Pyxidicoccus fallax]
MRPFLLAILFTSAVARAGEARDGLSVRLILRSEHPDEATHRIYVKGEVVTTLRFEKNVDAGRTKMLGWEGRLEPLAVIRNKVVLEPVHDLDKDEAIPLVVTLTDGTEVSFLVRAAGRKTGERADQQVDVFEDRESYAAMHAALTEALRQKKSLEEEVERFREQETSQDHALAALLASGAVTQTPFKVVDRYSGKDGETDVRAQVFKGNGKVAVVFNIKNVAPEQPWSLKSARLVTLDGGRERAVAVRTTSREISPGESGVVALVVDGKAFLDEGKLTSLSLELYREDGRRQAFVQLDPTLVAR